MDRRSFLKISGALGALGLLGGAFGQFGDFKTANSGSDWLLLPHLWGTAEAPGFGLIPRRPSEVRIYDSQWRSIGSIPTPFLVHSCLQDERNPEIVYAISKWGQDAAVLSLRNFRLIQTLQKPERLRFFGHGVLTLEGDFLIAAHDDDTKQGKLLRFHEFELVEEILSGGTYPHELRVHPLDPDLVVVANSETQTASRLSWLNWRTGQLLKSVEVGFNRSIGHFQFLDATGEKILLYGTHTRPAVELIEGEKIWHMESPQMSSLTLAKLETLNALRDPSNPALAWVTCPGGDQILQVDLKKREIVRVDQMKGPRNVFSQDGRVYITHQNSRGRMTLKVERKGVWEALSLPSELALAAHSTWVRAVS